MISFADSVLETLWDVLPVSSIKEYMQKPLTDKYLPFTNEKFVDATKKDTLFLNSVKNFILLYSPLTLISFVCVNLLRRVSRIVRSFQSLKTFDFWMYLLVATVFQNSQYLMVYSSVHFRNSFSFDVTTKVLQFASIFVIFFVVVSLAMLLPMLLYFYGKKSVLFLNNLRFSNMSLLFMGIKYIAKPTCESILHSLLFDFPNVLIVFCSLFMIVLLTLEVKFAVSESKSVFWI